MSVFCGIDGHMREIVLDEQPVTLRMPCDVWKNTPDVNGKGSIMLYQKMNKDVFVLSANLLLSTPDVMRVFVQSMLSML